ncbi:MAG: HDOD domain-containing protein [Sulfuricurvum sp.]
MENNPVVTAEQISLYIQNIPPAPSILKQTLDHARKGDLIKAAKCAEEDPALKFYLKTLVNRPIYGFRNEVHEVSQIFGILGVSTTQQMLYHYLLSLLTPKKWQLFTLQQHTFYDFQASLSQKWEKILRHLGLLNHDTESAITLLPASIIVCDALFGAYKTDVELLKSVKALDYNTILYRLSKQTLFDLCTQVADKWEMPPAISRIVHASSGLDQDVSPEEETLAKWMHLLLFFELSQNTYVNAGLNEFIDFQIDFVQDIYESFMQVVEYDESNR